MRWHARRASKAHWQEEAQHAKIDTLIWTSFRAARAERRSDRSLTPSQREEVELMQLKSYRWTFLVSGIEHPNFVKVLEVSAVRA